MVIIAVFLAIPAITGGVSSLSSTRFDPTEKALMVIMAMPTVSNVDQNVGLSSVGFGFRPSSELMVRY